MVLALGTARKDKRLLETAFALLPQTNFAHEGANVMSVKKNMPTTPPRDDQQQRKF